MFDDREKASWMGYKRPQSLVRHHSHPGFWPGLPVDKTDWCLFDVLDFLFCASVSVSGVGMSVNVLKKEFHCLKKRVWKTQAVLCILGVKSQEHGNFSHPASLCVISHQEALTDFLSPPPMWSLPASKAPQQASTSWVCVGEGPSFPWEPLPGDDMAPPGRPRRCADVPCTAHLSKPGHHTPHECSQSFFHSELHGESGTLLVPLRYKQYCFGCLNLHKIPIDLEPGHFPKCTYYKIEGRNSRDRRKTSEIQKPHWEP